MNKCGMDACLMNGFLMDGEAARWRMVQGTPASRWNFVGASAGSNDCDRCSVPF